jgi:hypothetical protein
VKISTKIAIIKISVPSLLLVAVFLFFRLALPSLSHNRRLFDLGADYDSYDHGIVRVYYSKKTSDGANSKDSEDLPKWLAKQFDSFVSNLEKSDWGQKLGITRPEKSRIKILLHATNQDYARYWRENSRIDMESAGKYRFADRTIGLRMRGERELILSTFRHETIHMLLDIAGISGSAGSQLPPWINEGLAQYFESGFKGGTTKSYDYTDKRMVPIERLVKLTPKEFVQKDKAFHHYRESCLLVAFLMDYNEQLYRDRFLNWVQLRARRPNSLREFASNEFSLTKDEFMRQFRSFLDEQHPLRGESRDEPR